VPLLSIVLLCCLLSIGVSGCASRVEPIYNVVNHPVPVAAQKLPLQEIGHAIVTAAAEYHWSVALTQPGQIRATYDRGEHQAVIAISYSRSAYSINLVSSEDLKQRDGEIHRKYNLWIRNLERAIEERLDAAAVALK
jgi:hypothetical protein